MTANATSKPDFRLASAGRPHEQFVQRPTWEAINEVQETRVSNTSDKYDVDISLNEETNWHLGDGDPPADKMDLSTIIMREVYTNLIFSGRILMKPGKPYKAFLYGGIPGRFDRFLVNKEGCSILGYLKDEKLQRRLGVTGDELLAAALTNQQLYIKNESMVLNLRLHAPRRFDKRNSVYHTKPSAGGTPTLMEANSAREAGAGSLAGAPDSAKLVFDQVVRRPRVLVHTRQSRIPSGPSITRRRNRGGRSGGCRRGRSACAWSCWS